MTDATDADRATTAIHADELNQLVAAARSSEAPSAIVPRATEAIPPIVMILDRPRSVIDGLVQSAGRTATRLVTLTRFRAIGRPTDRPSAALPDARFAPPPELGAVAGEIHNLDLARSPARARGSRPHAIVCAGGVAIAKPAPIVDRYLLLALALVVVAAAWLWLQRH